MNIEKYQKLRPCLWHLTTRENWISMRKQADGGDYTLSSTATLHAQAESPEFELESPRTSCQPLQLPWGPALIRDQQQLANAEKRLSFPEGWDLGRYCSWLNEYVFFWPGTLDAPSTTAAKKHFRYHLRKTETKLTFLKLDAQKILDRLEAEALFADVSSGAPSGRKKVVERKPGIFVSAGEINVPSDVVEVVFHGSLTLRPDEVTPVAESRMREHLGVDGD
jgi:hypothetical protein